MAVGCGFFGATILSRDEEPDVRGVYAYRFLTFSIVMAYLPGLHDWTIRSQLFLIKKKKRNGVTAGAVTPYKYQPIFMRH